MLSPDYYSSFRCKINRCRVACCNGWPVTFSMQDYFRLLSLNCTEQTKSWLDRALHLTAHPTEEEYAMILPGYDGNCPMRMKDGRFYVDCCRDRAPGLSDPGKEFIRGGV